MGNLASLSGAGSISSRRIFIGNCLYVFTRHIVFNHRPTLKWTSKAQRWAITVLNTRVSSRKKKKNSGQPKAGNLLVWGLATGDFPVSLIVIFTFTNCYLYPTFYRAVDVYPDTAAGLGIVFGLSVLNSNSVLVWPNEVWAYPKYMIVFAFPHAIFSNPITEMFAGLYM